MDQDPTCRRCDCPLDRAGLCDDCVTLESIEAKARQFAGELGDQPRYWRDGFDGRIAIYRPGLLVLLDGTARQYDTAYAAMFAIIAYVGGHLDAKDL